MRHQPAIKTAYHLADAMSLTTAVALLKARGYVCAIGSRGWIAVDHSDDDSRSVQQIVARLDPDAVMLRL
jgi:hypothetical protein